MTNNARIIVSLSLPILIVRCGLLHHPLLLLLRIELPQDMCVLYCGAFKVVSVVRLGFIFTAEEQRKLSLLLLSRPPQAIPGRRYVLFMGPTPAHSHFLPQHA